MEKRTSGFGSKLGGALKKGALVGGIALAGVGIAGLKMAFDLEKGLAEVRTLLPDLSDKGFNKLQADVLALSKEMGIATSDIVPALYQAISAGVPKENVIDFLRTGAKASIGGVTDLETAVDGLTTITNAWGLESSEAGRIADVMFSGVKLGKTTMAELSASMFQAAPLAAALGISVEEVVAATATLTKSGVPTSVAMTQMRQTMVALTKPTADMTTLLEKTGFATGEALIEAHGFTGALEILNQAADGNTEILGKAFGSVEALGFVLATTGDNAAGASADLALVKDSTGAADAAFETMEKTASRKLTKAINILKVELTKLGIKVLPVLATGLTKVLKFLEENEDEIKSVVRGVIRFATAVARKLIPPLSKLIGVVLKVSKFLKDNKEILLSVGIAIVAVLVPSIIAWTAATIANAAAHIVLAAATLVAYAPILLLIAGIALLAFGIIQLIKNWDKIVSFMKDKVAPMFEDLWAKIDAFLGNLPLIGAAWDVVKQIVKDKIDAIIGFVQGIIDMGRELISFFKNIFKGEWGAAWTDLKDMAKIALGLFLDFLQLTFLGTLESIFSSLNIWGWAKEKFETFKTEASNFLSGVASTMWGIGEDIAKGLGNGLRAAKGFVTGAINTLITVVEKGLNFIISAINVFNPVGSIGRAFNLLSGLFGGPKIPSLNLPRIELPRLHLGALEIPRDLVAQLQAGEMVLPRQQAEVVRDVVRAPQPAGIAGMDKLVQALQGGSSGGFNATISVGSEREAASQIEMMLRRLAFSVGVSGA